MSSFVALRDPRVPLLPGHMLNGLENEVALLRGGMRLLDLLRRLDLWSPDCPVVELGCRDGRLAYGLLQTSQRAPYFGLDGQSDAVDWMRNNLLEWLPERSNIVTMADGDDAGPLPWPSWQPELVFLSRADIKDDPAALGPLLSKLGEHLTAETSLCLNLFLLNSESRQLYPRKHNSGRLTRPIPADEPYVELAASAGWVAYDEEWIHEQFKMAGLKMDTILYGGWCGRMGAFTHHDLVVLRHA